MVDLRDVSDQKKFKAQVKSSTVNIWHESRLVCNERFLYVKYPALKECRYRRIILAAALWRSAQSWREYFWERGKNKLSVVLTKWALRPKTAPQLKKDAGGGRGVWLQVLSETRKFHHQLPKHTYTLWQDLTSLESLSHWQQFCLLVLIVAR